MLINCLTKTQRICWFAIFVIWGFSLAAALWAPLDIMDRSSLLRMYASFKRETLGMPGFDKSSFPGLSELYFSIIWLTAPFIFVLFFIFHNEKIGVILPHAKKPKLLAKITLNFMDKIKIAIMIILFSPLLSIGVFNRGQDIRMISLGTSRLELGLFGIIVPFVCMLILSTMIFGLSRIIKIDSGKLSKKHH